MSVASEKLQRFVDDVYIDKDITETKTDKFATLSGYDIKDSYTIKEVDDISRTKLPLSGGTLAKPMYHPDDDMNFSIPNKGWDGSSSGSLHVGWEWSPGDGSSIALRSKNYEGNPGGFACVAKTPDESSDLYAKTDGTLNWSDQRVHVGNYTQKTLTVASAVACSTTAKTYSLASYLPNDGHAYMVLMMGRVITGSTSGNDSELRVYSDLVASGSYIWLGKANTRASNTSTDRTSSWLPVGTGRNVYAIQGAATGTFYLYARGFYRLYKV